MKNSKMKIIHYNSTNYYLLQCNNGYLLIDAGWSGKFIFFQKQLKQQNVQLSEIKYLFLTHHHHDHAALVQEIRDKNKAVLITRRLWSPSVI